MPRRFELRPVFSGLGRRRPAGSRRDPRAAWRVVLGVLAAANLAAAYFVVWPAGGSPQQLDEQLGALRVQVQARQAGVAGLRSLVSKIESARREQEQFLSDYFLDSRSAASTILSEITGLAKTAGLTPKDHTFPTEPVEGSDTLSLMTINGNYEGRYTDLVRFVNLLDRSKRFLIIENITAAPQQAAGMLAFRCKINTFVREVAE